MSSFQKETQSEKNEESIIESEMSNQIKHKDSFDLHDFSMSKSKSQ